MNYRPLTIGKLNTFIKEFPEYTIGEILHSLNTQVNKKNGKLLSITDRDLYTIIDRTINFEKE